MHVGMSSIFQGFAGPLSDREVYEADFHLAGLGTTHQTRLGAA